MSAAAEVTALLLSHHDQAGGFHSKPRSASPRGAGAPSAVSSGETQLKLGHRWCCGCPKSLAVPAAQSPALRGPAKAEGDANAPSAEAAAGGSVSEADGSAEVAKQRTKAGSGTGAGAASRSSAGGAQGVPSHSLYPSRALSAQQTQHRISLPAVSSLLFLKGHLPTCGFCPGERSSSRCALFRLLSRAGQSA